MFRQLYAILILSMVSVFSAQADIPEMAKIVRAEALRSQHDPNGRPLPLVASWERATLPPSIQIEMIRDGVPLLPWIDCCDRKSTPGAASWIPDAEQNAIKVFKEWNIPVALLYGGQWESSFYTDSDYTNLPIDQTGVGMNLDSSKMKNVSPFSPVEPWKELGNKWTNNPAVKLIETLYPDPPLVFFISNNEAGKLQWSNANTEKRYVDLFGANRDDEFKRKVFGDGWIQRYSALFQGMRDGLAETAWKNNSRFIGYNAFGPVFFGRWWGWKNYSLTTNDRIAPDWYSWDGGAVNAYDNDWEAKKAYYLWSMQSETMNLVFMKDEAFKVKPEFWFELIFWDGYYSPTEAVKRGKSSKYTAYQTDGIDYTPELYSGWTQYNLWISVPRVAREFRYSAIDQKDRFMPYFQQIISAVKRVHTNLILTRFWRKGELVVNPDHTHPFSDESIPATWRNENRWFHLSTNLDPSALNPYPNALYTKWPVWTLARVLGNAPNREWLVYAHAPLGTKSNVRVTIPNYNAVELPTVAIEGSFYHISEASGAINQVINDSRIQAPSLKLIQ